MKVTTSTTNYLAALVGEDAEAPGPPAARSQGTTPAPAAHSRFPDINQVESCFCPQLLPGRIHQKYTY